MQKKNKEEIIKPLAVLMEQTTEKVVKVINESQLDIYLKIEVLQSVLQIAISTAQKERARYESQLKEMEEKNGGDRKTK